MFYSETVKAKMNGAATREAARSSSLDSFSIKHDWRLRFDPMEKFINILKSDTVK